MPNSMRPCSPPEITFTDFWISSLKRTACDPEGAADGLFALWSTGPSSRTDCLVVFEVMGVVLSVVAYLGTLGPFHRCRLSGASSPTRVRSRVVLPMPLGPMMATRSPASTVKLKFLNSTLSSKALDSFLDGHCLAVQLLVLLEADERADAAGRFDLGQLDLVDLLGAAGGLLGLGGVGREAADEGLQLGDLCFFLGVVRASSCSRDWVAAVMYSS